MISRDPATSAPGFGRKVLFGLLLAGIAATAWVTYFLLTFDLNDYRSQLESRLEDYLSEPVEIGRISYQMQNGTLGLRLRQVRIGDSTSTLQVALAEAHLELLWRELVRGQLRFRSVSLDTPQLQVALPATSFRSLFDRESADLEPLLSRFPFEDVTLSDITIRNGSLRLAVDSPQAAAAIAIDQVAAHLSGFNTERTRISTRGVLQLPDQGQTSPFQAELAFAPDLLDQDPQAAVDIKLEVSALDMARAQLLLFPAITDASVHGSADLLIEASREGTPQLRFAASLQSSGMTIETGVRHHPTLTARKLEIAGNWQNLAGEKRIDDLVFGLDRSRIAGWVDWQSGPPARIELHLSDGELPVTDILPWLPAPPPEAEAIVEHLQADAGKVSIKQALIVSQPGQGEDSHPWALSSFTGQVHDLDLTLPDNPKIHLDRIDLAYRSGQVTLSEGTGQLGSAPLVLDGKLSLEGFSIVETSLRLKSTLSGPTIRSYLKLDSAPGALSMQGTLPFRVEVEGPPAELKLNLLAELAASTLQYDDTLRLSGQAGDYLSLNCAPSRSGLDVEHADFQWSGLQGHFNGVLVFKERVSMQLDGLITFADLATLSEITPLAANLHPSGQADLDFILSGSIAAWEPDLTLTLRDVGLDTGAPIADLSGINGRIKLSANSLAAERIQGFIGESAFTADLQMRDFEQPKLVVTLEAPRVRAKDLIFPAEKTILHDVQGTIVIDRDGVQFDPVTLTLEAGTKPVIRGKVAFSDPPVANLDISADFAVIDEVINLWVKPRPSGGTTDQQTKVEGRWGKTRRAPPRIEIQARVEEGRLYGMQFHEATGLIRPVAGRRLIIHPLDFHIDEGFCNAQVLVDFVRGQAPLLRVSGHVEDVDALAIYRELLGRENIVRGRLRGDFYLQGGIGKQYLSSSYGRFHVEIEDGVLHKFQVLSKVFSLLNVSQLITFQLPDMDREGMPYQELTGNFSLDGGRISTTDLVIRSEAMNQAYQGSLDLIDRQIDMVMAVHPLGTVDKLVSRVPIAGWLLTGKDQALVTAHFSVKGPIDNPRVTPVPITSLSSKTIGLLRRTLDLPFKLFDSPEILWGGQDEEK